MEIKVSNFPLTSDMLELDLFCLRFILQITLEGVEIGRSGGGAVYRDVGVISSGFPLIGCHVGFTSLSLKALPEQE